MKKSIYFLVTLLFSTTTFAASPNFSKIFQDKNACFILYDLTANKPLIEYNQKRCQERVFACSTFKIPIAIMAFDQGILRNEHTNIKWDGIKRDFPNWNQDQTPKTWLQYSTVWVSQWITPQIGMAKIKKYLAKFAYGNQDMSGGITKAWLSSSLKISAEEQINFLKNLWQNKLPVSQHVITMTKNILPKDVLSSGAILYGKTGSGFIDGRDDPSSRMVGWYVGYLIQNNHSYAFATSSSDIKRNTKKSFVAKALSPGEMAKAATKEILLTGNLMP
jgi:beta-lactamase class D